MRADGEMFIDRLHIVTDGVFADRKELGDVAFVFAAKQIHQDLLFAAGKFRSEIMDRMGVTLVLDM